MTAPALLYRWDGEAFWPRPAFVREADRQFTVGETYRLGELEDRSDVSHSHQFAFINEAWKTLPERLAAEFPTATHLRKRALIETGQFHETRLDVGTHEAALAVATTLRAKDAFAWIVVRGCIVIMREAKSQKRSEMKGPEFQESKTKVLEWVSNLIGVEPGDLQKARAA